MCCSSNVRPVCLPWQENDPGRDLKENKKAVVTGWGRVKTSLKDLERKQKFGASARNLLYVRLPIANQVCEDDPDLEQYWDPETKICAGGKQGEYNFLALLHCYLLGNHFKIIIFCTTYRTERLILLVLFI